MRPDVNHYDPAYNDSSIDWDKEEKKELAEALAEIAKLRTHVETLQDELAAQEGGTL